MLRFLLVAGLAATLIPAEAQAKRGGGVSAPKPAARPQAVVVPGAKSTATGKDGPTRVPFPQSSTPVVTQASSFQPAPTARASCDSKLVGGFCVVN